MLTSGALASWLQRLAGASCGPEPPPASCAARRSSSSARPRSSSSNISCVKRGVGEAWASITGGMQTLYGCRANSCEV